MFAAHSYEVIRGPWGEVEEHDRFQCNHCGSHKRLKPGHAPEFTCKICMGFICGACANLLPTQGCRPQEKYFDEMERNINRSLARERTLSEYARASRR